MSVGAIAMNLSTLTVAANPQLLRILKLARTDLPNGANGNHSSRESQEELLTGDLRISRETNLRQRTTI